MSTAASTTAPTDGRTFMGHPRGLATLFFTEMWERFSYYGMRALLVLFMTEATVSANPGFGLDIADAAAIYGLYTSLVYLLALPGGWVADQLWGQRKAIFVGGCIIAAGHFSMAIPTRQTFFLGLALVCIGTGLLKPNVSTIVADLYPEGGARRDAGFSVFYMGINLGSFLGQVLVPLLGEGYKWHWGFSAAGLGMVLGLIQYRRGYAHLGTAGELRTSDSAETLAARERRAYGVFGAVILGLVAFAYLVSNGTIPLTLTQIAQGLGSVILVIVAVFFLYLHFFGGHTVEEKKKIWVIFWFFVLSAVFWSGFEQAGSSLNLFARDFTDRTIGALEYPAGLLQSVNAFFIIIFAPIFGSVWLWLAKRNANPSTPLKMALGLLLLAAGFLVISWGAVNASGENPASASWLVVMYFLHTTGELTLSPIGLSAVTKLAPVRRVGQMMGIWFVATALGNLFAGLVAGSLETLPPAPLFRTVAIIIGGVGLVALVASPVVKRMMGDVK
ncbi:MAG: peptide MFS transporter [Gemmatimonadetes bacterium]|nr:peptide MFS transporter [Gemmatimonadota bacterium]